MSIYSKSNGKAGNENKYELPKPIDEELYFGNLIILMHCDKNISNTNCLDLTVNIWEKI